MNETGAAHIDLLLSLRLRQLHDKNYKGITYQDLERVFKKYIWKHQQPRHLSTYAESIFSTSDDAIIRWLTLESKIMGTKTSLSELLMDLDMEEGF